MAEVSAIKYFCPGSCEDLSAEEPRDTGNEYFGPSDEDDEVVEPSQQDAGVVKTEAKPEPGTFYSIPETCVSGMSRHANIFGGQKLRRPRRLFGFQLMSEAVSREILKVLR